MFADFEMILTVGDGQSCLAIKMQTRTLKHARTHMHSNTKTHTVVSCFPCTQTRTGVDTNKQIPHCSPARPVSQKINKLFLSDTAPVRCTLFPVVIQQIKAGNHGDSQPCAESKVKKQTLSACGVSVTSSHIADWC